MSVFGNRSVHGNLSSSGITRGDVTLWDGIEPQGLIVTSNPKPLFDIGKYGMDTDGEGVWVVSGYNTSLRRNQSLRSTNNGVTWIELPDGINGNLGTNTRTRLSMPVIYVIHSKTGVWLSLTCENRLGRSTNNGKTWKNLPPSTQTSSTPGHTTGSGTQLGGTIPLWHHQMSSGESGLPVQNYQKMVALATDNKGTWININEKGVYKSTNDGGFFHKVANVDSYMNPGAYSNSNYCDLYTDDGNKWIYVTKGGQFFSTNGGSTWTKYPTGLYPGAKNQTYYRLTGNGKGKIIATGKPYAAVSNDNGRTWTKLSMVFYGSSSYYFPYNIVTNKKGYWIILPWMSTNKSQYSVAIPNHSFDDGNTWYPMTNTLGRYFYHLTDSSSVSTWKNSTTQYDAYGPIRIGADNKIIVTGSSGLFGTNFPISLNSIPSLVFKNCGKTFGGMSSSVKDTVQPTHDPGIYAFDYDGHQTIILGEKKGYAARSDDGGLTWRNLTRGLVKPLYCKNDFTLSSSGSSSSYAFTIEGGPATSNYFINLVLKIHNYAQGAPKEREFSYGRIFVSTGMTKEAVAKKFYDQIISKNSAFNSYRLNQNIINFKTTSWTNSSGYSAPQGLWDQSLRCDVVKNEFNATENKLPQNPPPTAIPKNDFGVSGGSGGSHGDGGFTITGGPATGNYILDLFITRTESLKRKNPYTGVAEWHTTRDQVTGGRPDWGNINVTKGMTKEQLAQEVARVVNSRKSWVQVKFVSFSASGASIRLKLSDYSYQVGNVMRYAAMIYKQAELVFRKGSGRIENSNSYASTFLMNQSNLYKGNASQLKVDSKGVYKIRIRGGPATHNYKLTFSATIEEPGHSGPNPQVSSNIGDITVTVGMTKEQVAKKIYDLLRTNRDFRLAFYDGVSDFVHVLMRDFKLGSTYHTPITLVSVSLPESLGGTSNFTYFQEDIVSIATDKNGIWLAVMSDGNAARSTDNGRNWTKLLRNLNETSASSSQHGFCQIVTDRKGVWIAYNKGGGFTRSTNNGINWKALPKNLGYTASNFYAPQNYPCHYLATDCKGVWVYSGYRGSCARSVNNGETWTSLPKNLTGAGNSPINFRAIATDESGTWVAIADKKYIMISRDNGATWNQGTMCGGHAYNKFSRYKNDYDHFTFQTLITNKKGFWMIIPSIGSRIASGSLGALPTLVSTDNAHTWHEGPAWLGVGGKLTLTDSQSNYKHAICVNDKIFISGGDGLGMNV